MANPPSASARDRARRAGAALGFAGLSGLGLLALTWWRELHPDASEDLIDAQWFLTIVIGAELVFAGLEAAGWLRARGRAKHPQ